MFLLSAFGMGKSNNGWKEHVFVCLNHKTKLFNLQKEYAEISYLCLKMDCLCLILKEFNFSTWNDNEKSTGSSACNLNLPLMFHFIRLFVCVCVHVVVFRWGETVLTLHKWGNTCTMMAQNYPGQNISLICIYIWNLYVFLCWILFYHVTINLSPSCSLAWTTELIDIIIYIRFNKSFINQWINKSINQHCIWYLMDSNKR